ARRTLGLVDVSVCRPYRPGCWCVRASRRRLPRVRPPPTAGRVGRHLHRGAELDRPVPLDTTTERPIVGPEEWSSPAKGRVEPDGLKGGRTWRKPELSSASTRRSRVFATDSRASSAATSRRSLRSEERRVGREVN